MSRPWPPTRVSAPALPVKAVIACPTVKPVGTGITGEHVTIAGAQQVFNVGDCIACRVPTGLRAGTGEVNCNSSIRGRPGRRIGAGAAIKGIGPVPAFEDVLGGIAGQGVVKGRAREVFD